MHTVKQEAPLHTKNSFQAIMLDYIFTVVQVYLNTLILDHNWIKKLQESLP